MMTVPKANIAHIVSSQMIGVVDSASTVNEPTMEAAVYAIKLTNKSHVFLRRQSVNRLTIMKPLNN